MEKVEKSKILFIFPELPSNLGLSKTILVEHVMCVLSCGTNFRTQHSYIGSVVDSVLRYFAFHVADLGSRPEPGQ